MNRRTFLASLTSAAAVAAARCASPANGVLRAPVAWLPGSTLPAGCALPPVHVSPDREIRTIAGLRPYRRSGFVVRAEKIGDQLVVHNYGHGGGGITLSWGTAKLAVEMIPPEYPGPVAVLGCGAVGLATTRLLQERGRSVTVYAKDLPPNTTSNVAGGQWFPFLVFGRSHASPEFLAQFFEASLSAYRRFQTMVGPRHGVRWIRNYSVSDQPFSDGGLVSATGPLAACLPEIRDLGSAEHPFPGAFVRQFDSMLIEPPVYLAAVLEEARIAGATIRVQEIADRSAIRTLPERVIVNCTGLGARALFGDEELVPLKGQLTFLLPQPEVDYTILHDDTYMFPRSDGILLGGTHEEGVWTLTPDEAAKAQILEKHRRFFEAFRRC